ncbi:MAG: hypothetical protein ABI670_14750 [Chloroflexota bacterium]|jgi:hypothetical protein
MGQPNMSTPDDGGSSAAAIVLVVVVLLVLVLLVLWLTGFFSPKPVAGFFGMPLL